MPRRIASLLAAFVTIFSFFGNFAIAGGADSYGYLSQADLWLNGGDLHVTHIGADDIPWPFPQQTLAPLGYRPSADAETSVPTYPAGLPMVFALFKAIGGQCALRLVIPLAGGLLVMATFAIGRLMFSDHVGAAAAWLVATSPVVLSMLRQPMSDIPVAAFWGLVTYGCLLGSRRGALMAGVAAATAILIRPNLAHLAVLGALWLAARNSDGLPLGRVKRDGGLPSRIDVRRALLFCFPVATAVLAVALINRSVYGSVTSSGYGDFGALFSQYRIPSNLTRYTTWLVTSQTPIALIGLIAVFLPLRLLTRGRIQVPGRALLAMISLGVMACYALWIVFDAWWYLRFLLPLWPAMCVTTAWLLTWPSGRTYSTIGKVLLLSLGIYGLWFSHRQGIFDFGEGDYRYVNVAHLVRDATPPNSMIFALQHSGSVRYYGERMTLRWNFLHPRWLDRSVAWLSQEGMHSYFLLDESEIDSFQQRFSRDNTLGRLEIARIFEYEGAPRVYLYDALQPVRGTEQPLIFEPDDFPREFCAKPGRPPQLIVGAKKVPGVFFNR
jgi:hypothetical protein